MTIRVAGEDGVRGTTSGLRSVWEATSFQLERLQCNPACVKQEVRKTLPIDGISKNIEGIDRNLGIFLS